MAADPKKPSWAGECMRESGGAEHFWSSNAETLLDDALSDFYFSLQKKAEERYGKLRAFLGESAETIR